MGKLRLVPISFANHYQSKLLLSLFSDRYRVKELGNNKIALGWKSRYPLGVAQPPPRVKGVAKTVTPKELINW